MSGTLFWFRQDLRLRDNPGLAAAARADGPLHLLYILDEGATVHEAMGGASRWWLHHSLCALAADIEERGATLIVRQGDARTLLPQLAQELDVDEVFVNGVYEPGARGRDDAIRAALDEQGTGWREHAGGLLFQPGSILNKAGDPYRVFTPFWRSGCLPRAMHLPAPARRPKLEPNAAKVDSLEIDQLGLLPTAPNWATGFPSRWSPGEDGARKTLRKFAAGPVLDYDQQRDQPSLEGTSRLSPHLHFGEVAPWTVWHALVDKHGMGATEPFLRQLGWREFSYHLLWHFPDFAERNWRREFDAFPWRRDAAALRAWQRGQTGYPIVDAGMRQLWQTGWMHNRVRMIVASFLIKHLLLDWRAGERWFWDTLVDADMANNAAGWQWVAGSGADASPYFRIFNPISQSEKFDAQGDYLREWLPELRELPDRYLHAPWDAPAEALTAAGVTLGKSYPRPLVEHKTARQRALDSYKQMREQSS